MIRSTIFRLQKDNLLIFGVRVREALGVRREWRECISRNLAGSIQVAGLLLGGGEKLGVLFD